MITVVKGISGSGKSTRVYLFLSYLRSLGLTLSDFNHVNHEGKKKVIGVFIEELNVN